MDNPQERKLIAESKERIASQRKALDWINSMEQRALLDPDGNGPTIYQYVLRNRRNIRRFLRSRFGVHFRYRRHRRPRHWVSRSEKRNFQMSWPFRTPDFAERFPTGFKDDRKDQSIYSWYMAWEQTLYWFDGAQIFVTCYPAAAIKTGSNADLATVEAFADYCRKGPWMQVPTKQAQPDPALREEYIKNLAAWARWQISFSTAKRLKETIRDSLGSQENFMDKFLSELIPSVVLAYHEMEPGESLVPIPGQPGTNFISRIETNVEKAVRDSAGNLGRHEQLEETLPDRSSNEAVDDVELSELMSQYMSNLTPRQRAVVFYTVKGKKDDEIAQLLETSKGNVQTLRSQARKRLEKALRG